ncbi:MAG: hypothetical protein RIR68_1615, partial [Pseudomonadota bacterium]
MCAGPGCIGRLWCGQLVFANSKYVGASFFGTCGANHQRIINGSSALAVDTGRVAQALGAPVASDAASGNVANTAHQWNLLGVVAGASGKGSALLSVDGQAPKAFLPGQSVAPGWVLHSV